MEQAEQRYNVILAIPIPLLAFGEQICILTIFCIFLPQFQQPVVPGIINCLGWTHTITNVAGLSQNMISLDFYEGPSVRSLRKSQFYEKHEWYQNNYEILANPDAKLVDKG